MQLISPLSGPGPDKRANYDRDLCKYQQTFGSSSLSSVIVAAASSYFYSGHANMKID